MGKKKVCVFLWNEIRHNHERCGTRNRNINQREGNPRILAGHAADLERNQSRMDKKFRVCRDRGHGII